MGRRKQKQMLFVQGDSLAEEVDSDDERSGGLHIGNAVILRAPMSSRSYLPEGLPRGDSRSRHAAGGGARGNAAGTGCRGTVRTNAQEMQEQVAVTDSDDSLDDELQDYMDNIRQADSDDTEAATAEQRPTTTAETAGRTSLDSSWEDWNDSSGSRPGLGFHSATAAARFADVKLDGALEGMLARDLSQTGVDDSSSSESSDYESNSSSSSNTSDDGSVAGAPGVSSTLDIAASDGSTAFVVDAHGQALAAWEQLPLEHRFPVQTRQQQQQVGSLQGVQGRAGSRTSKGKSSRDRQGRPVAFCSKSGGQVRTSPAAAAASGLMPPDMPCFACAVTTAAVKAAYAAAAAAADLDSVQRQQQRKQQKSLAKGANRGQLLPGEKKKLRKEKIAAKRAVRRSERGQGALALVAAVEEFALSGSDMTLLPACGKHRQAFIRSVAALYGIKASARGGSSSSKSSLVLMSTSDTAPLNADSALQLQSLLVAALTQELVAAAVAADPVAAGRQGSAAGQRAGMQEHARSPGQGLQRQRSRGAAVEDSVYQQPVAFVSAGVLDPNSSRTDQVPQDHPVSAQTTTAAAAGATTPETPTTAAAAGAPSAPCDASIDEAATAAGVAAASFVQSLLLADETDQQVDDLQQPGMQHVLRKQQQQQRPPDPAWVVDKEPWSGVQQQIGLGFASSTPPAVSVKRPTADTLETAAGHAAPLYDKPAVHFGLGFCSEAVVVVGLGVQQQVQDDLGPQEEVSSANTAAAQLQQGAAADGCQVGQRLQELENKFAAMSAAPNPAASRRQQRRQQQERQQRVEARLSAPNTAMGPVVAAGFAGFRSSGQADEEGSGLITLGLTKQQVKKANKQQQRNARREARAAAAAAGDAAVAAAATVAGNTSGSFAGFEAHTRGIGSRLMAGWGWREGEGLGRARQGRAEPVQATRRARHQGLGAE